MLFLLKHFKLIFLLSLTLPSFSQNIVREFKRDSLPLYLVGSTTQNKIIPSDYNDLIRLTLCYYPELKDTKIKFRIRKRLAPLSARPALWGIFTSKNRTYLITISNGTLEEFRPILLENLSLNAQIGVIGHELAHIAEYNSKKGFFFIQLALRHFNQKQIDRFEYDTDYRCIEHLLAYQLLAWSTEVRIKLKSSQWGGTKRPMKERYMNPETIQNVIKTMKIYAVD